MEVQGANNDPTSILGSLANDVWSHSPLQMAGSVPGMFPDPFALDLFDFSFAAPYALDVFEAGNPRPASLKRRRGKTYTGCLTCRERKIKCDLRRPVCSNCERSRRYVCRGFVEPEIPQGYTNESAQPPTKTRVLEPASPADVAASLHGEDHVIAQDSTTGLSFAPIGRPHNEDLLCPTDAPLSLSLADPIDSCQGLIPGLEQSPSFDEHLQVTSTTLVDGDLLQHYQNVVSHFMMPTLDASMNPWLKIYLPLALGEPPSKAQLALRHALMSVAAHNLAQTEGGQRDAERATFHRTEARSVLERLQNDSLEGTPETDKYASLAAAMSLISIDVFSSDAGDCNVSLNLAKRIVQSTGGESFWKSTLQSSILYQIFRCYVIVGTTAKTNFHSEYDESEFSPSRATNASNAGDCVVDNDLSSAEDVRKDSIQDDAPYIDHYILDTSFGIGLRTMSLLHRTVRIGAACDKYGKHSLAPSSFMKEIEALRTQLYSIENDPLAFTADKASSYMLPQMSIGDGRLVASLRPKPEPQLPRVIRDELIENHQWAFHYAVILYFHRVVPASYFAASSTADTIHATANHQHTVGKILDRLEDIDCLTVGVGPANTLWPAFIAAVEAVRVDLRHRVLIWFSKAAKRGIGNIPRAKKLVTEIWRRVDRQLCGDDELLQVNHGLGPVDWRIVMEEMGHSIMLT